MVPHHRRPSVERSKFVPQTKPNLTRHMAGEGMPSTTEGLVRETGRPCAAVRPEQRTGPPRVGRAARCDREIGPFTQHGFNPHGCKERPSKKLCAAFCFPTCRILRRNGKDSIYYDYQSTKTTKTINLRITPTAKKQQQNKTTHDRELPGLYCRHCGRTGCVGALGGCLDRNKRGASGPPAAQEPNFQQLRQWRVGRERRLGLPTLESRGRSRRQRRPINPISHALIRGSWEPTPFGPHRRREGMTALSQETTHSYDCAFIELVVAFICLFTHSCGRYLWKRVS